MFLLAPPIFGSDLSTDEPPWRQGANHILVSTSNSLLIVAKDLAAVSCLHKGNNLYYGLATSRDHLYVAARNRIVSSSTPREKERGEILVFDRNLRRQPSLRAPFPLIDLHEIAWHQGRLYMACSYENFVAIWDGKTWEKWYPFGQEADYDKDSFHFNSFLFERNMIWVLAHRHGPSELLGFDPVTRELRRKIGMGRMSHNIWREGEWLHTCSSEEGVICSEAGVVAKTGGFPRGICRSGEHRYVGVSEFIEREKRDFSTPRILKFDLKWNLVAEVSFPRQGLLLDIADLAGFCNQTDGALINSLSKAEVIHT